MSKITVPEVIRAMNVDLDKSQRWAIGAAVRERYRLAFGELPPKDNRPKSSGKGSHCFALYPSTWRSAIEEIVREIGGEDMRQPDLF
jgi:hypothetical protein